MADPKDNEENSSPDESPDWQRKQYRVQSIIAYGGLAGLCVLSLQWCEMRKSTNAATEAIRLSRETARLDQRAWVGVDTISGTPKTGEVLHITVSTKNTGKTMAKKAKGVALAMLQPADSPPDFAKRIEEAEFLEVGIVAPNGISRFIIPVGDGPLESGNFGGLKAGGDTVFVFGKISYDDVFDCSHWITFCSTIIQTPGVDKWEFTSCHEFNRADENRCP